MNELSCCITHIFDNYYIIISSIITIIQQFLFFIIAAYFKFDKNESESIEAVSKVDKLLTIALLSPTTIESV